MTTNGLKTTLKFGPFVFTRKIVSMYRRVGSVMTNARVQKSIYLLVFLLGFTISMYAQPIPKEGDVIERVEAVAGREVILKSEIDGQLFMLAQQNRDLNVMNPQVRQRVRDALINDKLVYTKALEDSTIQVSEEEINQQLEATIQQIIAQFGSEERVVQAYGVPMWKIRKDGHDEIRKRAMLERMRQTKLGETKVTRSEVEQFYAIYRDSLPEVSEQVELHHIVKLVVPASSTKELALNKAKKIRDSITAGGDFCDFAKRYSADPGTAGSCGELSMRMCSDFVPEFCSAAKKLQLNELSLPVETPFGYHLIQLQDRTKDQIRTRHILVAVPRQDADVEVAKKSLVELKQQIDKKELSFIDAARNNSDEKETKGFGGFLGKVQLSSLDPTLRKVVEALKDGEVSEPLSYSSDRTKPSLHILWRRNTIVKHRPTLESDYKEIERLAESFKQNKEYEAWIKDLRAELYWEVKE